MTNKALSVLSFSGFILLIVLPLVYYQELPETIPTHYGLRGIPDNHGSKSALWVMTGIGAALYIGLKLLGMNVHRFKFSGQAISKKQMAFYHQYTRQTLEMVSLITMGAFTYINYATIQIAFEKQQGLGPWFLPLLFLLVSGLVIYTLWNARKMKKMEG